MKIRGKSKRQKNLSKKLDIRKTDYPAVLDRPKE